MRTDRREKADECFIRYRIDKLALAPSGYV